MDMKRFSQQVVVVTGAASGIGRACAERFAQEGARVACLDLNEMGNQTTLNLCRKADVTEAIALSCNVADANSIRSAIKAILARWGRIDVLVAAAGVYSGAPLAEVEVSTWQRTLDINLTGVFLTNQAVAAVMIAQQSGSIINLSSMAGKTSWAGSAEYSASKAGVIGLTRSVAMELAPHGATANAICPGNTRTEMVLYVAEQVALRDGLTPEDWLAQRAQDCPMHRMAEPWEIAGVAAFLASDDARYLTGQAIEVDGGMVMS